MKARWATAGRKEAREAAQRAFLLLCKAHDLPEPVCEYRFDFGRRFRLDYAWPDLGLAVEQDGGTWISGHHANPKQMASDREKGNIAALLGIRVFHFTPEEMRTGEAISWLKAAMKKEELDVEANGDSGEVRSG